ncbi:MAG: sucrose phosphorylase [Actinomycetota bacterium]
MTSPQLITYPDRLAPDLSALGDLLDGPLRGAFGGVHVLPFFDPIDGADAGFDPIDHLRVDPRIGTWSDIARLATGRTVMADLIVNHVSAHSTMFSDVLERGERSAHRPLFLDPVAVFGRPPTADDLAPVYRPRPTPPITEFVFADGATVPFWTTFSAEQIDIDVESPAGWEYLVSIIDALDLAGVTQIRFDAVGYAIKRAGTSCFMIPDTFDFIERVADMCHERGIDVLVEVHSHYLDQLAIAERVDLVYDFALPPLVLDALFTGRGDALRQWIAIRPTNAVTVLDTHDGIGVVDVGVDPRHPSRPGLLAPARIDALVEGIHERSRGESQQATGAAASNLDLYQVNCTFFDALGGDEQRYLAARLIQLLLPGTPQIYYVGLLAGGNDLDLLMDTGVGRDINRHHFTSDEIDQALERPVVQRLLGLLRWRATEPAFDGSFELLDTPEHELAVRWSSPASTFEATVDFTTGEYSIT